jgi:hypothetical protein
MEKGSVQMEERLQKWKIQRSWAERGGILVSVEVLPRRSSGVLRLKEEEGQEVTLLRDSGGLRGR